MGVDVSCAPCCNTEYGVLCYCILLMFVPNASGDHIQYGSKRHSLQAVDLSQRSQTVVQIVSGPIYRVLGTPAMQTRWMAGAASHKSG